MIKNEELEKKYIQKENPYCPYCQQDDNEHRCSYFYCARNDIKTEECFNCLGYCSQFCIDEEKNMFEENDNKTQLKKDLGIMCNCNDVNCGKCLSLGCVEDGCPVHTLENKSKFRNK